MSLRRFLAIPVLLALAACSATGSSSAPAAATSTPVASASASESAAASASAGGGGTAEIDAEDSPLGTILVDADGNTIYFFSDDSKGVSTCTGDCIANWPAVNASTTPEAGNGVTAKLGTLDHPGGSPQLTVNGFPAYYFAGDQKAGDTNGQGLFGKWFVFGPDGAPVKDQ
ncbi:MAG TPA: hypothetical protein VHU77_06400 [Candidatus Limnocylindria bacterium]|jgi:predicted lipoprotein with Yx(FWY)xxD motif|nr:hypothetical protein [Candidatus Limnocylindria bacterium]